MLYNIIFIFYQVKFFVKQRKKMQKHLSKITKSS